MKDCILLKNKEYEDLVSKANSKKPEHLNIYMSYRPGAYGTYVSQDGSIDFSSNLRNQIGNISHSILKKLRDTENTIVNNFVEDLKNKSKRELYKFIQNYNDQR